MAALSARWDWYPTREPAGKVVWCELRALSPARRGVGEGREPPFVRMNRPAEMAAAGQRGKWDILAGAMLREDSARFTDIYRLLLRAARAEGIDRDRLPDFLDLEDGGEFALLGQDELGTSVFESALRDQIARSAAGGEWPEQDTERIILAAARVGHSTYSR